jgi:hypothetical protein
MTVGKRLFNIAAVISTMVFCATLIAWLAASRVDPRKQFISLTSTCHISLLAHQADARLVLFNDADYGPYQGSFLAFAGDPNFPQIKGIGDIAGLYYRFIRWPDATFLWTLTISLLYPVIFAAVLPVLWMIRRWRYRRRVVVLVEGA